MSLTPSEGMIDKLKGIELDSADRARLDGALVFCGLVIVALLFWKPPVDAKIVELAMSNAWIVGCVTLLIYVAGVRFKKPTKAPKPPEAPTVPAPVETPTKTYTLVERTPSLGNTRSS